MQMRPKKVFVWIALSLAVLYCANLGYSFVVSGNKLRQPLMQPHLDNFDTITNPIEGLILGGSNALYGLSADLLSEGLGTRFYNFSFPGEASSLENYDALLETAATVADFSEVRAVIWSSIEFYHAQYRPGIAGNRATNRLLSVFPNESLLRSIWMRLGKAESSQSRSITPSGDLDFALFHCTGASSTQLSLRPNPAYLSYIAQVIVILRSRFPKASVVIVAPPLFEPSKAPQQYLLDVQSVVKGLDAEFIFQAEIESQDQICDAYHHPNAFGRATRTLELVNILNREVD
ncbi:MAG: hypothetical protein ACJAZ1_003568 [Yoonia sp.]|jgi:hypothetical protein